MYYEKLVATIGVVWLLLGFIFIQCSVFRMSPLFALFHKLDSLKCEWAKKFNI